MDYLQADTAVARENKMSTQLQDSLMPVVEKALLMMRSVENVEFVDSLVIPKTSFFKHYGLSASSGRIIGASVIANKHAGIPADALCYLNDFGDIAYLPLELNGKQQLCKSQKIGGTWQNATELQIADFVCELPNYPYVLSDGVTLYFAAKGEEALGGYDIFVTRYDAQTGRYMKPENLGMPFNSPANDYLYVIDEAKHLGWFATDRGQEPGNVCIYKFIPNSPRRFYSPQVTQHLPELARIASIRNHSGTGMVVRRKTDAAEIMKTDFRFPINDNVIYFFVGEFKSEEARKMAEKWLEGNRKIEKLKTDVKALLKMDAATETASKASQEVRKIEDEINVLQVEMQELEKQIRNTENKELAK